MRLSIFHFTQDALIQLKLSLTEALLLDWLVVFSNSNKMKFRDFEGIRYYWVRPAKVIEDLPCLALSERQLRHYLTRLSGHGDIPRDRAPLMRLSEITAQGSAIYYAFNPSVYPFLIGQEAIMENLIDVPEIIQPKGKIRDRILSPITREMLDVLLKIRSPDDGLLFQNNPPEDDWHYTKDIEDFSRKVWSIYAGRFLKDYPLSDVFFAKNHYTINNDNREMYNQCKGSWEKTTKLVFDAARHYRKWWRAEYEPENKDWLPRSLSMWMYNPRGQASVFWACMKTDPPKLGDLAADRIWESLPKQIIDIAEVMLLKKSWNAKSFWHRIGSVRDWYVTYARKLEKEDPNVGYWIDGGQVAWFRRYSLWLIGLAGSKEALSLGHLGTDCPTWAAWCTWATRNHHIRVELPSK